MNKVQKIVIIIGSIILVASLISTPEYQFAQGTRFAANTVSNLPNQYDFQAAVIRSMIVISSTIAAYFLSSIFKNT